MRRGTVSRAVLRCVVLVVVPWSALATHAQQRVPPSFVASIKLNPNPDDRRTGYQHQNLFTMVGGTFRSILGLAYPTDSGVEPVGLPEWTSTERYDMTVRFEGEPTAEERLQLWRQLFAERLNLAAHYERRELPTFTLERVRTQGPLPNTIRKLSVDCDALQAALRRGETVPRPPDASNGARVCTSRMTSNSLASGGITMQELAAAITRLAGRQIVVAPGLEGFYEFTLEWSRTPGPPEAPDGVSIFTALREQVGLQLTPSRSGVEILVIDQIERPTPN